MDTSREEESNEGGGVFVDVHGGDGAVVDVSEEEIVHGSVEEMLDGNVENDIIVKTALTGVEVRKTEE